MMLKVNISVWLISGYNRDHREVKYEFKKIIQLHNIKKKGQSYTLRVGVHTAMWLNIKVFWDVIPCSWASSSQFDCLPLKITPPKSFKTSGATHPKSECHIPEV